MGVLVILLIVGLSFTGNYHWAFDADNDDHPTPSDPAICYMRPHPGINSAFLSMPYLIILTTFGFVSRVINLYDTLSVGVVGRARTFLARPIRRLVYIAYDWSDVNDWKNVSKWSGASGSPRSLKLVLCYLPLLSVYFTCLVLVDVWDAAVTEVRYLICNGCWLYLIFSDLGLGHLVKYRFCMWHHPTDKDNIPTGTDWPRGFVDWFQ